MKTDTKVILISIVASIVIILGGAVVFGKDTSINREAQGQASLSIDKMIEDLGSMKTTDEKTALFTLTNTSNSVLRIWNVSTSCNCTFATITINGQESEEFNMPMHTKNNLKNWIGEIPTKQTATLKVIYRPKIMPVLGAITRQVKFSTNDPINPEVEVSIKANVL